MLFEPYSLAGLPLRNRVVMAPMTRNRATADHVPTPIMATYYAQRAGIRLIITEAVHAAGGKIFAQLMHTGRASHVDNVPPGARVVSSAEVTLPDPIYTDSTNGVQPATPPHALTGAEVDAVVQEYVIAARNAIDAGFDGVELHAANGYLIEQFLNANLNKRTDRFDGSADNRNRFALNMAKATAAAICSGKVGIRVSPHGAFNGMGGFDGVNEQYIALAKSLGELGLAYLHLVNHASMGAPALPAALPRQLKDAFGGPFIASGGLDRAQAEALLASGDADLVAFGRPALANPDLVARLQLNAPFNPPDFATFYTPGEAGYADYPALSA